MHLGMWFYQSQINIYNLSKVISNQFNLNPKTKCLVVGAVKEGSAAHAHGIERFDIILSIDGESVYDYTTLVELFNEYSEGDSHCGVFASRWPEDYAQPCCQPVFFLKDKLETFFKTRRRHALSKWAAALKV